MEMILSGKQYRQLKAAWWMMMELARKKLAELSRDFEKAFCWFMVVVSFIVYVLIPIIRRSWPWIVT